MEPASAVYSRMISPKSGDSSPMTSPPQSPLVAAADARASMATLAGASSAVDAARRNLNPLDEQMANAAPAPAPKERKKPGRKPKPVDPNAPPAEPKKRTRKPRDPDAAPGSRRKKDPRDQAGGLTVKAEPHHALSASQLPPPPRDPFHHGISQNGNSEAIRTSRPINSFFTTTMDPTATTTTTTMASSPRQPPPPPQSPQSVLPPRSSGQVFDPVRQAAYDPVRDNAPSRPVVTPSLPAKDRSPTIQRSPAAPSFFASGPHASTPLDTSTSLPPSPITKRSAEATASTASTPTQHQVAASSITSGPGKRPANGARVVASTTGTAKAASSTASTSKATSPKPAKGKEKDLKDFPTPPPLPGTAMNGDVPSSVIYRGEDIVLDIPLTAPNKVVNFAYMAQERYGFDALHPRLAAQQDRLARVAAAGAALERNGSKESGDEMSVDLENEGDGSNVEMGGMSDAKPGNEAATIKTRKKRKMKEDEYDKDDGFVDDSEMLWETHQAATNDGFFVYSGPLVPEGEKATVDSRADGAPKRGRGRGARAGGTTRRGGGPGSRGGKVPGEGRGGGARKSRMSKADKTRLEQEKAERERAGGGSGGSSSAPSSTNRLIASATTPTGPSTPMIMA